MQKNTIIPLQNNSLGELMDKRRVVELLLHSGLKVKGVIKGFDNFTLIIDSFGIQQLVYKHAVAEVYVVQSARKSNNYQGAQPVDRKRDTVFGGRSERPSNKPTTRPRILTWSND